MSEAYECDRCGTLHSGKPHTTIHVEAGHARSRPGEREELYDTPLGTSFPDLCSACLNDLRRWYRDGGGDPADVTHPEVGDE